MTQEQKHLLLVDLCGRLPYGVVIQEYNEEYGYSDNFLNTIGIGYFSIHEASIEGTWINHIENIKPYLRPISSMTEEEKVFYEYHKEGYCSSGWAAALVDWLNKHHLDYRDLISTGLALEAPEGMYNNIITK